MDKKRRVKHVRPTLDLAQRIQFLEMVAQMSSRISFERKLGLSWADVEFYKKSFDVESPDEARRLATKLKASGNDAEEARVSARTKQAREAAEVAQARLEALETKKQAEEAARPSVKVDVDKVRQEDAQRQRLFAKQQSQVSTPAKVWQLPMVEGAGSETEQVDRFRRDIVYRGFNFIQRKHGATAEQVKYEAARLGLKINWDIVKR